MKNVTIGAVGFRISAQAREGHWIARAERADSGDRFGPECAGPTEMGATARVERWLEWQRAHEAALDQLQRAERAFHRTLAGSAFACPADDPMVVELQRDTLEQVKAAREDLDEIRCRRPDC